MVNAHVLSERYATDRINTIFSEEQKVRDMRMLWVAVMIAQKELGVNIPSDVIERHERVIDDIDLDHIRQLELKIKHDVDTNLKVFTELAGTPQHAHKAMTARDVTDNIEQMQLKQASLIIRDKYVSVLRHFADKARVYQGIALTARTHHQPAQLTVLGRRFSMWAEELLFHLGQFEHFIDSYALRGIKGPVGTQADQLTLLGSREKVAILEQKVAEKLGFDHVLVSPGQVYPRSLDYALNTHLSLLSAACQNFAISMRLMSGYEIVTEGFSNLQTGSSAMPHKMNTRTSERVWSACEALKMYVDGASRNSGAQWEEGDVSCSLLRRIINPDPFYASDAVCESTLTVLNEMGAYPAIISREVTQYLPFLATTTILRYLDSKGITRDVAHPLIKEVATAEAKRMRETGDQRNNLVALLAQHPTLAQAGITSKDLEAIMLDRERFMGDARQQVHTVCNMVDAVVAKHQEAAAYEPKPIL